MNAFKSIEELFYVKTACLFVCFHFKCVQNALSEMEWDGTINMRTEWPEGDGTAWRLSASEAETE